MDLWSRLIGGTGKSTKIDASRKDNPQQRLSRYKALHVSVQEAYRKQQSLRTAGAPLDQLYLNLQEISSLLRAESQVPAPHTCFAYAAAEQTYNVIGRVATVCRHEGVVREAVAIFSACLDSGSESFAASRDFAKTLMRFAAHTLDAQYCFVGTETESQLLEVLFGIAAKIRLSPELLPVWFSAVTPTRKTDHSRSSSQHHFVGSTRNDDFPLCYMFIDRIHQEGQIGDFARTGLLYIFEVASRSVALEAWMLESDIPTLMASALGALYSQLSRELSLSWDQRDMPLLLAMSDGCAFDADVQAQSVHSPVHIADMSTLLSALVFWQDVLERCHSLDIKRTLFDHFQILFLQQLLYPSILQSSDTDAGSSVAVLTYMANMFETLHDVELMEMMLDYLFAVQKGTRSTASSMPGSPTVSRRRSFLLHSAHSGKTEDNLDPRLFGLTDLTQNALSSANPQTVFAGLSLLSSIATHHPRYAIGTLIGTREHHGEMSSDTIGHRMAQTTALLRLVMTLGEGAMLDRAFTAICLDMRTLLQANRRPDQDSHSPLQVIDSGDAVLGRLTNLLGSFLSNEVDVNLALTQAIVRLLACSNLSLDSLMCASEQPVPSTYTPAEYESSSEYMNDAERAAVLKLLSASNEGVVRAHKQALLMIAMRSLITQIDIQRSRYPRFDYLLAKRSAILVTAERPTSSAGYSDIMDDEKAAARRDTPSSSTTVTPRKSTITSTPGSRSLTSTPRGRNAARRNTNDPGSPTPRPRLGDRQSSSFLSPTRLTRALFSGPLSDSPPTRRSSSVFLQPPPAFELDEPEGDLLKRMIRFPLRELSMQNMHGVSARVGADDAEISNRSDGPLERSTNGEKEEEKKVQSKTVSLSHVLTNVVVLRNFLLELAAVLQVRAIVYDDVSFV